MTKPLKATRIGNGVYRVEEGGEERGQEGAAAHLVFVAGPPGRAWAFFNGHVFQEAGADGSAIRRGRASDAATLLTAPMPATVLKVLVEPGTRVAKGDVVLLLEAMKMELPVRAPADAVVKTIRCRAGELVQPDVVLVDFAELDQPQ
jgi:biotin carboxyl carrier protein